MPEHRKKLKRIERPDHVRFLTFSCLDRRPLLSERDARDLFAERLMWSRKQLGFSLLAWVVMPEHVHLLILPRTATIPSILMRIKRPVAATLLRDWRTRDDPRLALATDASGRNRLWQAAGGYDRNIFTDSELEEKARYIEANPVRRGLADRPDEWEWSSARRRARLPTRWPGLDRV